MSFAVTWMGLEIVIQSEVSQKEEDKYCIISLICGIHKNSSDEYICKAEIEFDVGKNLQLPRAQGGVG